MTLTEIGDRIEWRNVMARMDILERRQREILADRERKVWFSPARFGPTTITPVDADPASDPEQAA